MNIRRFALLLFFLIIPTALIQGCSKKPDEIVDESPSLEEAWVEVTPEEEVKIPIVKSPLTGLDLPESLGDKRIVSVMVENEYSSRPQSGLDRASVVYEALAEGGITRFLALYLDEDCEEIGPVRSSRPYFLDWAMEYDSVYVHYGASPHAYEDLKILKLAAIDGIYDSKTFWRDKSRKAPHNAYTNIDKIAETSRQRGFRETSEFPGFNFLDLAKAPGGKALREFTLTYFKDYQVKYIYDDEKAVYHRYINGKPHTDRISGDTLTAKNIIIQFIESYVIPGDKEGRLKLKTVGSGKGYYISDGEYINICWEKGSRNAPTQYLLEDGGKIKFNPGNTWIQILPQWGKFQEES